MQELHGLRAVPFQKVVLASAPRAFVYTCCKSSYWFPWSTPQERCFGRIQDYAGATFVLLRCVEIPQMAFWHDSRSSRRSGQVDTWRENPGNNAWARFGIFKLLPSNEPVPSIDMHRCREL
eukprot:5223708-Pyramimonas_sp.AAC.1